jgi:hypothetical protein
VYWQVLQFGVLTASEILVSTTGLEFFYSEAPPRMKGTVLALYYIAVAVGDMVAGSLYSALGGLLSAAQLIWLFTGVMAAAAAAFGVVAYRYQPAAQLFADKRGAAAAAAAAADTEAALEAVGLAGGQRTEEAAGVAGGRGGSCGGEQAVHVVEWPAPGRSV